MLLNQTNPTHSGNLPNTSNTNKSKLSAPTDTQTQKLFIFSVACVLLLLQSSLLPSSITTPFSLPLSLSFTLSNERSPQTSCPLPTSTVRILLSPTRELPVGRLSTLIHSSLSTRSVRTTFLRLLGGHLRGSVSHNRSSLGNPLVTTREFPT